MNNSEAIKTAYNLGFEAGVKFASIGEEPKVAVHKKKKMTDLTANPIMRQGRMETPEQARKRRIYQRRYARRKYAERKAQQEADRLAKQSSELPY